MVLVGNDFRHETSYRVVTDRGRNLPLMGVDKMGLIRFRDNGIVGRVRSCELHLRWPDGRALGRRGFRNRWRHLDGTRWGFSKKQVK
jgi:hypothetical protein